MRQAAAGPDRAGAAGLDELAQPGAAHPRPDRRRARATTASDVTARQLDGARARSPAAGRPAARGRRHVSARAQRRHEAARLHRHRHQPAPQGDHRRRADQRARRGGAAPGDGDARPGPAGAGRRRDPGRPRHGADGPVRRPPRRDVRRAGWSRSRRSATIFTAPLPSVHADADRQPAVARAEGRRSRASRGSRRRCATCRPAARSIPAARSPWTAAGARRPCSARRGPAPGPPVTSRRARHDRRCSRRAHVTKTFGGGLLDRTAHRRPRGLLARPGRRRPPVRHRRRRRERQRQDDAGAPAARPR